MYLIFMLLIDIGKASTHEIISNFEINCLKSSFLLFLIISFKFSKLNLFMVSKYEFYFNF